MMRRIRDGAMVTTTACAVLMVIVATSCVLSTKASLTEDTSQGSNADSPTTTASTATASTNTIAMAKISMSAPTNNQPTDMPVGIDRFDEPHEGAGGLSEALFACYAIVSLLFTVVSMRVARSRSSNDHQTTTQETTAAATAATDIVRSQSSGLRQRECSSDSIMSMATAATSNASASALTTASSTPPTKHASAWPDSFSHALPWQAFSLGGIAVSTSLLFQAADTKLWASAVAVVVAWSDQYSLALETSPIITKSVTSAVIGIIGDFGAQWIEHILTSTHDDHQHPPASSVVTSAAITTTPTNNHTHTNTNNNQDQEREHTHAHGHSNNDSRGNTSTKGRFHFLDLRRGWACAVDGLLLSGPILHYAYDLLEYMIPIEEGDGSSFAALLHVLINDFFLDAIFVAILFVSTAVLEGCAHDLRRQMANDYLPAVKASIISSVGLFPIEFLCFRFLPLDFRVLSMNFIDIIWGAMISYMAHRSRGKAPTMTTPQDACKAD